LRAKGIDLPIIFITGVEQNDLEQQAISLFCVAYLRKPFDAELLINAVNKAMSGRESRRSPI